MPPTAAATTQSHAPITIAGRPLGSNRHICAFFHTKDEEYRVLRDFIQEGLTRGEKAFHVIDARRRAAHMRFLRDTGVDTDSTEASGQLEVRGWEQAYLRDGHFDQGRMLRLIEEVLSTGKQQGYALTRLVANMEWALEDRMGVNDIVEYETRLNSILPKYDDPVICTYDLSQFNASVVMDMLRTHPAIIIGGILQENPLYVPPQEFLSELSARGRDLKAASDTQQ